MKKRMCALLPLMLAGGSALAEETSGGFLNGVAKVNDAVNGVVWGVPALILLAFVGVLMTCLTKVFQLSHFKHWMSKTIGAVFHDKHVTGHTKDNSYEGDTDQVTVSIEVAAESRDHLGQLMQADISSRMAVR